jgi:hypothetical protein
MQSLPRHLQSNASCNTTATSIILQWGPHKRTVPLLDNNCATFYLIPGLTHYQAFSSTLTSSVAHYDASLFCMEAHTPDTTPVSSETTPYQLIPSVDEPQEEENAAISPVEPVLDTVEAEFLHYHYRYNHISPQRIRAMAQMGILPKRLATCNIPICPTCLYGKATRRPWRQKPRADYTPPGLPSAPGQAVSVDFLHSPTPGLVAQLTGIPTSARYTAAAVYVDQATGYGFVYLQKSISEEETLQGKLAFERHCQMLGTKVQHYHADNGIFVSNGWKEACSKERQSWSYTGVSAHHQNGIAERRIRELQDMARTMIIHAQQRWPDAIDQHLWPYALRMANDALNACPSLKHKAQDTPESLFTGSKVLQNPKHWNHFGCPAFVLARPLQSQGIYHKWKQKSTIGVYIGRSPVHSREVALVLSLDTGLVSPQFHVKLDSTFQTIKELGDLVPKSHWQVRCGFSREPFRGAVIDTKSPNSPHQDIPREATQPEGGQNTLPEAQPGGDDVFPQDSPIMQTEGEPPLRRSTRIRNPVERLTFSTQLEHLTVPNKLMRQNDSDDPLIDNIIAYAASTDPDTMYYHEAMKEPDAPKFVKAMIDEIQGHLNNGNFTLVKRSSLPKGARVLPAVWQMKRKRRIATGEVYKHKARCNIDGSKQIKDLDYDQTYSPVTSWPSLRLFLTFAIIKRYHSRQIDFVQAYTQAEVERRMYMEIPKGFEADETGDYVLRVDKNIYGQKQAGRVWNEHLVARLKRIGFSQSTIDPCVFTKGDNIYILYVDDSILMGPDSMELDKIIEQMKRTGLELTVEGDMADFLGVKIDYRKDGTIHLTQPHLIESILAELHLNGPRTKFKSTPAAASKILSRHSDSDPFDNHFHFRRVIGKLNYLEKSTRPDIAYAVHQCARFTSDPKVEHSNALKWLGRYLAKTKDKGLILRPEGDQFEVYVDADFAGNWNSEDAMNDPDTARSRYGYIVMYNGCPITWASRMQTEIALSSTESEYIGLSQALRSVIPIMELVKELQSKGFPIGQGNPKIHCKLFEDNSGAIELAKVPKMRPRTKHINVKYHHFREYVSNNEVSIHKIDTSDQPADILTKPLNEVTLERHRNFIMGW